MKFKIIKHYKQSKNETNPTFTTVYYVEEYNTRRRFLFFKLKNQWERLGNTIYYSAGVSGFYPFEFTTKEKAEEFIKITKLKNGDINK